MSTSELEVMKLLATPGAKGGAKGASVAKGGWDKDAWKG